MNNQIMKVQVTIKSDEKAVKEAMLVTTGNTPVISPEAWAKANEKPLSNDLLLSLTMAKHSPIEEYVIVVDALVPERVHTHIVRHEEIGKYVTTSRPDVPWAKDIQDGMRPLRLVINLKRMVEIMQQRLCKKAWKDTRFLFLVIREKLEKFIPRISILLQPPCVWYDFCPECKRGCGYIGTTDCMNDRDVLEELQMRLTE